MSSDHQQYLAKIEEASTRAKRLSDENSNFDFMDLFHTFLNLKLSAGERLQRGLRKDWKND
jgi:hypothetical protein